MNFGRPEHSEHQQHTISAYPRHPPPPQSGRHMYIIPRLKIEEVLKQNLAEHLYKYFAMKTFDHLEQPFAGNELDNVLVNLEDYRQHHKFLI